MEQKITSASSVQTATIDWREQWRKNYRGEGECEGLEKFVKMMDFGAKKGANYLPWAVAERIFRLQGGNIKLERVNDETVVEVDRLFARETVDINGVVTKTYISAYFINVTATWMGQTYTERYPLQDSNSRPLSTWSQNELNTAFQRAKVKAIAIVSGIGYKLFEDGDLQFDTAENGTSNETTAIKQVKKTTENAQKLATAQKAEPQTVPQVQAQQPKNVAEKVSQLEPETAPTEPTTKKTSQPQPETVSAEPTPEKVDDITYTPEERVGITSELKAIFLREGKEKQDMIFDFLSKCQVSVISKLTDKQLSELYTLVK